MPELPEVETIRRGLEPLLVGQTITDVVVRQPRLRWLVESSLAEQVQMQCVRSVTRRGKYLLITTDEGTLLIHLGMSGNLRFLREPITPSRHDHIDFIFTSGAQLRFNDPRRFGSVHFTNSPTNHWLIKNLGPEPLGDQFSANYLSRVSHQRRVAIKQFLMNNRIVVGVGNIYASEALFRAGVHPTRSAGRIAERRCELLVDAVRAVLNEAIASGGTKLRNFVDGNGTPGYFQQTLSVYGRANEFCTECETPIKHCVIGQRATYYCSQCQR